MKVPVEIRNGQLSVETRIGRFALQPVSEHEFVVEDMGTRVFFDDAADGKSIEFVIEPLWLRGAESLLKRGQPRDAVDALLRLAVRYPKSAATLEALGDALVASGQRVEAAARYRSALEIQPDRPGLAEKLQRLLAGQPK